MWIIFNNECFNINRIEKINIKKIDHLNENKIYNPKFNIEVYLNKICFVLCIIEDEQFNKYTLDILDKNIEELYFEIIKFLTDLNGEYEIATIKDFEQEAKELLVDKIKKILLNV